MIIPCYFIVHDETFQDNSGCGEGSLDVFHLHGQNEQKQVRQ